MVLDDICEHSGPPSWQVESILQLPQDPNLLHSDGSRALILASEHGHVEIARLLLEAGADKDISDKGEPKRGGTALMIASET